MSACLVGKALNSVPFETPAALAIFAVETPTPAALAALADDLRTWLDGEGERFHADLDALTARALHAMPFDDVAAEIAAAALRFEAVSEVEPCAGSPAPGQP